MRLNPTKPQYDYIFHKAPYPAMVAGFGAGKTEAAIVRAIIGKLRYPGQDRGFYAPTYDLIRMIAFPRFEGLLEYLGITYRLYKSPLNYLRIPGYGNIYFRSMDAPHRIVGYEHSDADVDELDTMKSDDAAYAWRQILARNRQKKPDGSANTIGCTTTPEGFKFVHKAWKKDPRPGYEIVHAPTYSNPHLPDDYIDSLKAIYPENLLQAYIDGQFVNLTSGTVYNTYDRDRCRSHETIKEQEPLFIGQDFNVGEMASTIYVQRPSGWHAVDQLTGVYDTPALIDALKSRYDGNRVYIYPDASGASRKTVNASTSDIAMLEQAGFRIRAPKQNPPVKDRILAVNGAFSRGDLWVNDHKCPDVASCLEKQAYDKNGEPDKHSGFDHQNDATGYPIAYELPVRRPVMFTGIPSVM